MHFASSPTVTGGSDPVSINCTRPSPSTYTLGTTTVTCVAIDPYPLFLGHEAVR